MCASSNACLCVNCCSRGKETKRVDTCPFPIIFDSEAKLMRGGKGPKAASELKYLPIWKFVIKRNSSWEKVGRVKRCHRVGSH